MQKNTHCRHDIKYPAQIFFTFKLLLPYITIYCQGYITIYHKIFVYQRLNCLKREFI